jgi:hypothetical protein
MPDMFTRPASAPPTAAKHESKPPLSPPPNNEGSWKPIRIPSPAEMGIASAGAIPAGRDNRESEALGDGVALAPPPAYDLAVVAAWLDSQGLRRLQREKTVEGVLFQCSFGPDGREQNFSARGANDQQALTALVQQVLQWKRRAVAIR